VTGCNPSVFFLGAFEISAVSQFTHVAATALERATDRSTSRRNPKATNGPKKLSFGAYCVPDPRHCFEQIECLECADRFILEKEHIRPLGQACTQKAGRFRTSG
jgi:hypothetical protein